MTLACKADSTLEHLSQLTIDKMRQKRGMSGEAGLDTASLVPNGTNLKLNQKTQLCNVLDMDGDRIDLMLQCPPVVQVADEPEDDDGDAYGKTITRTNSNSNAPPSRRNSTSSVPSVNILIEGMLEKKMRTKFGSKWHARYFALTNEELTYFKSKGGRVRGIIPLGFIRFVELLRDKKDGARFDCLIHVKGQPTQTLSLLAKTAKQSLQWVTAIELAMDEVKKKEEEQSNGKDGVLKKNTFSTTSGKFWTQLSADVQDTTRSNLKGMGAPRDSLGKNDIGVLSKKRNNEELLDLLKSKVGTAAVYEGALDKQSPRNALVWQLRYFVLYVDTLCYFKKPLGVPRGSPPPLGSPVVPVAVVPGKPCGAVALSIIDKVLYEDHSKTFDIVINQGTDAHRLISVQANAEQHAKQWVNAIRNTLIIFTAATSSGASGARVGMSLGLSLDVVADINNNNNNRLALDLEPPTPSNNNNPLANYELPTPAKNNHEPPTPSSICANPLMGMMSPSAGPHSTMSTSQTMFWPFDLPLPGPPPTPGLLQELPVGLHSRGQQQNAEGGGPSLDLPGPPPGTPPAGAHIGSPSVSSRARKTTTDKSPSPRRRTPTGGDSETSPRARGRKLTAKEQPAPELPGVPAWPAPTAVAPSPTAVLLVQPLSRMSMEGRLPGPPASSPPQSLEPDTGSFASQQSSESGSFATLPPLPPPLAPPESMEPGPPPFAPPQSLEPGPPPSLEPSGPPQSLEPRPTGSVPPAPPALGSLPPAAAAGLKPLADIPSAVGSALGSAPRLTLMEEIRKRKSAQPRQSQSAQPRQSQESQPNMLHAAAQVLQRRQWLEAESSDESESDDWD